jgi:hypothetical protein
VRKDGLLKEFMQIIEAKFNIPIASQRIMKKNPMLNTSTVELVSEEKNMDRALKQIRVNEGVNLYVENKTEIYPRTTEVLSFLSKMPDSKWETEFELDKNRFTLKFNDPLKSN